jgi:hypothetical protein
MGLLVAFITVALLVSILIFAVMILSKVNSTGLYDKPNRQLVVTWDPAIAADIAPTTVGPEVKLNSAGQLVLTVSVFGVLGLEVALDRQR